MKLSKASIDISAKYLLPLSLMSVVVIWSCTVYHWQIQTEPVRPSIYGQAFFNIVNKKIQKMKPISFSLPGMFLFSGCIQPLLWWLILLLNPLFQKCAYLWFTVWDVGSLIPNYRIVLYVSSVSFHNVFSLNLVFFRCIRDFSWLHILDGLIRNPFYIGLFIFPAKRQEKVLY